MEVTASRKLGTGPSDLWYAASNPRAFKLDVVAFFTDDLKAAATPPFRGPPGAAYHSVPRPSFIANALLVAHIAGEKLATCLATDGMCDM